MNAPGADIPPIVIESVDVRVPVPEVEKILPHGGGCKGDLEYGNFSLTTYTNRGRRVDVKNIWGYKCVTCGLVMIQLTVELALYALIEAAESENNTA